jgi:hypothetical protein
VCVTGCTRDFIKVTILYFISSSQVLKKMLNINSSKCSRLVMFFQLSLIPLALLFSAAASLDVIIDSKFSSDTSDQFTNYIHAQMGNDIGSEEQGWQQQGVQQNQVPDIDCLFEPSLSKCAADPISGCPQGFLVNVYEQCFPAGGCPEGYHYIEGDESGRCYSDNQPCPETMIMNPESGGCEDILFVCKEYPALTDCIIKEGGANETLSQNSTLSFHTAVAPTN